MNNIKKDLKQCRVVFLGMMGSGKTTVARAFSDVSGLNFLDLDDVFVQKHKISIKDYFKKFGEEKFRDEETQILKEALRQKNCAISTGGGVVLREENRKLLAAGDVITIYLEAKVQTIFERLKNDTSRPLLLVENPLAELERITDKRQKYYKIAKYTIKVDGKTVEDIVEEIYENIGN